ncbi:hypothetical protein [Streptomyces sp. NPDC055105]|uniref:hypothetical protein n=1 Tax=Streptomyces sp. NPDC055105 TaxID=3365719 RepID=UPI0037CE4B6F
MPRAKTAPPDTTESHTVDPGLQKLVVSFALLTFSTVVATALYGPAENSERAFRLLHWWKREPAPEPDERRTVRAKRR